MSGITINGVEAKLRDFFKDVEGDYVSVEMIFRNEKRNPDDEKDKNWFYSYVSLMKKHELAYPLKGVRNGARVTLGVTLTDKGRFTLRRNDANTLQAITNEHDRVTLASWRNDGYELRTKHPELVIEFDVRMRRDDE